ncbi:MAG: hypothetical protein PHD74_06070, partial [Candidatus Krumholzibacteria bacterium]|nr:hypothetical protein [Candidatus Krumholzibacteria bacterium]
MIRRLITAALMCVAASAGCAADALAAPGAAASESPKVSVATIDFLESSGMSVNGAGPFLVKMDAFRNRLIAANTLSSSVSIIDCGNQSVENIPLEGRSLQHLKAEALTLRRKTGDVYLIGVRSFSIASPDSRESRTIPTGVQFESIAVDEETGNVFLAGRESKELGFYSSSS